MLVLILPIGFTLVDPQPMPVAVKPFKDRIAAYWMLDADRSNGAAGVMWRLEPLRGDLLAEVEAINGRVIGRNSGAKGVAQAVEVEHAPLTGSTSSGANVLLSDLRQGIADGQILAVVGTGVSIRSSGGEPTASWIGLLRHGIDRCVGLGRADQTWAKRRHGELESKDMDELLSVAEHVTRKLGGPTDGEYRRWLRDTVGGLEVRQRDVLEALKNLGVPLATTNYDGLIEQVTGLRPVTWRDRARVERVLRGDDQGVLHLHGYWEDPASVVLGIRSYEAVLGDAHAQAVLRGLLLTRSLLFVGFGAGLADPNVGALLRWIRDVLAGSEYRHFRLAPSGDVEELQKMHPSDERIFVLPYGKHHADLAEYLRTLRRGTTPLAASSSRVIGTGSGSAVGRRQAGDTSTDALRELVLQEQATAAQLAERIREYTEWAGLVPLMALERARRDIETADGSAKVEVSAGESKEGRRPSLEVRLPHRSTFVYRLFLHERTGPIRAFVMKEYTGTTGRLETAMLFNDKDKWNDAKEITEDDVYQDLMREYFEYRRSRSER